MSDVMELIEDLKSRTQKITGGVFSITGSAVALSIGGSMLLAYSLSIGELPEFTLGDLTGTLIAVSATGVLVTTLTAGYCLVAGFVARSALEWFYPEAANHPPQIVNENDLEGKPYVRLTRGPFIIGATAFCFLCWISLFFFVSNIQFTAQHDREFNAALRIALISLGILIYKDWRKQKWRSFVIGLLMSIFAGAAAALVVLIVGSLLDSEHRFVAGGPPIAISASYVDWKDLANRALNHVYEIALIVLGLGLALTFCRLAASSLVDFASRRKTKTGWAPPARLIRFGDFLGRSCARIWHASQLMRAKLTITVVFGFLALFALLVAIAFSNMSGASHRVGSLIYLGALLTTLNWAAFSLRSLRNRLGVVAMTALTLFFILPVFAENPIFLPKAIVAWLGLGERYVMSVAISGKQCAVLAPYGVTCEADGDRAITLTNLNLLNRLGGSMVFELLVRRTEATAERPSKSVEIDGESQKSTEGQAPQTLQRLIAPAVKEGVKTAKRDPACNSLLLNELNDQSHETELTCIKLVVPKDQVAGYVPSGRRSYQGSYTQYIKGAVKPPTTIRMLDGGSLESRRSN